MYQMIPSSCLVYVTVQAKTSLVHTSKFATSVLYNFCWERSTESKFAALIDYTSLITAENLSFV